MTRNAIAVRGLVLAGAVTVTPQTRAITILTIGQPPLLLGVSLIVLGSLSLMALLHQDEAQPAPGRS